MVKISPKPVFIFFIWRLISLATGYFLNNMNERKKPDVLDAVRDLVNALPEDHVVYDPIYASDGHVPGLGLLVAEDEGPLPFAARAFPVYLFLLRENPSKVWSINKIYTEFTNQNPHQVEGRDQEVTRSTIALLAMNLLKSGILGVTETDEADVSEDTEFTLRNDDKSWADAYEYCAKLAEASGAPRDQIQMYRRDASIFRHDSY